MSGSPFDPGLQVERTLLAWRRTCLAAGVGSLLCVRVAIPELTAAAVVLGMLGVAFAAAAYVESARRYRRVHDELTRRRSMPPAGVRNALAAASVAVLAVACAAWLLVRAT